ncbi:EamA family transporter [Evansella tamaricis]|uniref:DMT family transporter n=1 Tax=Evansella tamaricis TaxID=2069301 RepID=A0ABS6JGQ2_9BACI|nr:DMT family transporter [Evansella tamaricis]MBU9711503.1 DMT family transporter [Evansella tamaricis]
MKGRWIGFVLVLLGASFWGVGGTVSQRLFQEDGVNVEWLVSVRLLISGIMMILLAILSKNRNKVFGIWTDKGAAVNLVIFGIFGMLAVQYTYMASINLGNAAVSTLLQYQAPAFIIIYFILSKKSNVTKKDVLTVLLALLGTFFLLTNGSINNLSVPSASVVWGVLSGIALAFYTLYAGPLLKKWGSLNVIGWAMIIGGTGLAIFNPPWKVTITNWNMGTLFFLIFVILFGTMFAFWFYLESLKYLKPQETSLLGSMEPLTAVLTSVLWLKIPFGAYQMAGGLIILLMVIYLSLAKENDSAVKKEMIEKAG